MRLHTAVIASLVAAVAALALPAVAPAATIEVTSTIQAAVDAASPGDTIVVPPGTYQETVLVDKSNITIKGSAAAVLDATGHDDGIRVGSGAITGDPPECPALSVQNFTLDGMTIRNADDTGLSMIGVDGFRVTGGRYLDNAEYGVFPRCSRDGLIDHNSGGGGEDATVYVGVDDNVTVEHNNLTNGEIGIELENTINSVVRHNQLEGNVAGILVVVLPGLPRAETDNALIEDNQITRNNLPNPVPPTSPDDLALLPSGTGILNVGGDHVVIRDNQITGNGSVGVAIVADPFYVFDPRIDPNPDFNEVRSNTIQQNGNSPDPDRPGTPAADIVYDALNITSTTNCFARNVFTTSIPPGVESLFPCA